MIVDRTARGFQIIKFKDLYREDCSLQQSSLADFDPPGSSAVWFGIEGHRMHLSVSLLEELLPILIHWLETGSFEEGSQ